ncbi:hypothetical protein [Desulfocurvibacter africanus]|uniref:hypothetical protein n=1 Tax=Desulfocurvibacter africanus TaxID=873 RepID=UPI000418470B|nr:hypothetical protein [Desulfocurvibacter africanus]
MGKGYARLTVFLFLLGTLLPAQAWCLDVFIGPRIGTLGAGAEAGIEFTDFIKLRGVVQGFKWTIDDKKVSGIEYDFGMNSFTAGALLDIHPLGISPVGGSFRVSAGAFYNANNFSLEAKPTETVTIGGTDYTASNVDRLDADVDFNDIAPYVGIGWGTSPGLLPFSFTADMGVLYQGSPRVDLSSPRARDNAALAASIESEEDDMEDDLSSWKWYPVVMVGFAISF